MATKKVAKKAVAKKAVAKKAVKKAPAKKAVAKKVAKKAPAKKAAVKKAVKKAPAKRAASTKFVVPPVPTAPSSRPVSRVVDTKPTAPSAPVSTPTKPVSKSPASSNRVVLAVVVAILALGAIVLSRGSSTTTNETPTESVSPSASATTETTESASPAATESAAANVGSTAAPLGIVAKYTSTGATIFWNATTATDGLKGYSIEFSSNGGSFSEVATVGADVLKFDITKSDTAGWTSFKVSSVYNDGQKAEGKVFGLPGQYK